jgi:chromosome segregation ATPase
LHQAYEKFKNFLQAREAQGASMMQSMRLHILAEDTYFQGVEVLRTAAEIVCALREIDAEKLQREVQDWQKQRQKLQSTGETDKRELSALERRIELNQQRLDSYRQRQSALAELFAESEACEASLEEAYMQFAGAESAVALPKSHVDNAITRLETAVAAARRVETRIRNMQGEDEIYLAAGKQITT